MFITTQPARQRYVVAAAAFLLLLLTLIGAPPALAAEITVDTVSDAIDNSDAVCSLPEAVANANDDAATHADCAAGSAADIIQFDPALTAAGDVTITLTNFDSGTDNTEAGPTAFNILSDITIQGAAGDSGITLARHADAPEFRLFYVDGDDHSGVLTVRDLTLRGGSARGGDGAQGGGGAAGFGGAILNRAGAVVLENVTLVDNHAIGGLGAFGATGGGGGLATDGDPNGPGGLPDGPFGSGGNGPNGGGQSPGGGGGSLNGDGGFGGGGGGGAQVGQFGGDGGYGAEDGGNLQGGNGGAFGGAIFNFGEFSSTGDGPAHTTVINSTISGNSVTASGSAGAFGSAIFGVHSRIDLINTTVVSNTHNGSVTDGMVYMIGSATSGSVVLQLQNTIIAHAINSDSALRTEQYIGGRPLISGDSGNNIIDTAEIDATSGVTLSQIAIQDAPLLLPLTDNGGPTPTHALQPASPAIDAGDPATCQPNDQRGVARDTACDIGAYEFNSTPTAVTLLRAATRTPSSITIFMVIALAAALILIYRLRNRPQR